MATLAPPSRAPGLVLSPDDDAALAARAVCRFHLRAFGRLEEAARAGDVEAVHQLRVTTRRLRATLRLFAPMLPRRFADGADRELAWVAGTVGAVRDLDVLFEAIHARAVRLDPELRRALGPVGLAIHEQREAALAALGEAIEGGRCRRLVHRLTMFADAPTAPRRTVRLGDAAPRLVEPLLRSVRRAARRLDGASPPAEFHRLRVRVKRLRYGLETLRGLAGKPAARLLARLEDAQDVLGASQDAVTQIDWLRTYAASGADVGSLLPVGALVQALARRGEKRRRKGLKVWRKIEAAKLLDDVADELATQARERAPARERRRA